MPVGKITNNRIPPSNARSGDVARDTINALIPAQNRSFHEAFKVQGYQGVLYYKLGSGLKCLCQSTSSALPSLDSDGKADLSTINQLISGGLDFGVRPYGTARKQSPFKREKLLTIDAGELWGAPVDLDNSNLQTDNPDVTAAQTVNGSITDRFGRDSGNEKYGTIINDGVSPSGPVHSKFEDILSDSGFDIGLFAHSDQSCPVCFGTNYVSGYSIFNGWRRSLVAFDSDVVDHLGSLNVKDAEFPFSESNSITWEVTFPIGVIGIDSFKLFCGSKVISGSFTIDSDPILSELQIINYCDGKPHRLKVEFKEVTRWSHLEVQLNLSKDLPQFSLPRLTKNSQQDILENTDPFRILLSPIIPLIRPLDIIVESSYGKALQVKSIETWDDVKRSVLGWSAEVRPVQPTELFNILPRRNSLEVSHRAPMVRDNSGNFGNPSTHWRV